MLGEDGVVECGSQPSAQSIEDAAGTAFHNRLTRHMCWRKQDGEDHEINSPDDWEKSGIG